jgi:phosphatidylinositol-3-phosphatase
VSKRSLARLGLAALVVLVLALPAAAARSAAKDHGSGRDNAPNLQHIFVIMLENHSQSSVIDDSNAPYITSLAHTYATAANYYGVTHPSEPNYVAAISGSNWFVNDDNPNNRFDHTNLVDQLDASHHSWGAYMESMPSTGYLGDYSPSSSVQLYASKHNPFVLFNDIRNDPARLANVKPYTALANDLRRESTTPDFVWISPNQCHDMHGGVFVPVAPDGSDGTPCPFGSVKDDANDAALKQKADAFVKGAVTQIMASGAWRDGRSAIFILTDENDFTNNAATDGWESAAGCCDSPVLPPGYQFLNSSGLPDGHAWAGGMYGGGLIPAIVVTNRGGKPHGYVSNVPYNHYSLLATVEETWGLGYLGNASDSAQVSPMDEFFTR